MRLCSLGQRKFSADQELQFALRDQPERLLDSAPHNFGHRRHSIEGEAADFLRFFEQTKHVERLGWATGASVHDDVSEGRDAIEAFLKGCRSDCIENQVRAMSISEAV